MDIHKPKPIHSPREFLIELATIVIGIVIALTAEALVEHLRIESAVNYSRADFADELRHNREDVIADLRQSRLLDRQMAALIQEGSAFVGGKGPIGNQHRFSRSFPQLRSAAWSSALSTQVMGHFPHTEGRTIAQAYSEQASFAAIEARAQDRWFDLAKFAFADTPTRAQVGDLLQQVSVSYAYLKDSEDAEASLLKSYDEALHALR